MYDNFLKNRNSSDLVGPAKSLVFLNKNWKLRGVIYLFSIILTAGTILRSAYHFNNPSEGSRWGDAFYATFGVFCVAVSFASVTLCMLLGRVKWLRAIFEADMW